MRRAIDGALDAAFLAAPCRRDVAHDLAEPGVQQLLQVFPLGRRQLPVGEGVHRALVFLALVEPRHDAELVQRLAQERRLQGQAGHVEAAGGLQPDLAEGARQVIVQGAVAALAEALREGDRELAALAKLHDRLTQLLHLGDAQFPKTQTRDQTLDPRVLARSLERLHRLPQGKRFDERKLGEGIVRARLDEARRNVERQHAVIGDLGFRRGQALDLVGPDHKRHHGGHDQKPDTGQQADNAFQDEQNEAHEGSSHDLVAGGALS